MALPDDLDAAYPWPDPPTRMLRVNFTASIDGGATVEGRSGGLSGPADRRVFEHLRATCDCVLVGAGTVRAERYRQARVPVVVVSSHLDLDPSERLFQLREGSVPPIIATHRGSPSDRRAALQEAGAEILDCGDANVDPHALVAALEGRGFTRILCEGGPTLFATLVADGLADELCLTVHPKFVGPDHRRIVRGTAWAEARAATLRQVIEDGGELLLRYGF